MDRGLRSRAVRSRSIALSGALYLRNNSASRMAVSTSLTCSDSDWELTIVCLMFGNSGWCFWGAPGSGRSLSQEIRTAPGILLESKAHHLVCRLLLENKEVERRYLTMSPAYCSRPSLSAI